jgi:hypothetical protein
MACAKPARRSLQRTARSHQFMALFGRATRREAERYTRSAAKEDGGGEAMPLLVGQKMSRSFPTPDRKGER